MTKRKRNQERERASTRELMRSLQNLKIILQSVDVNKQGNSQPQINKKRKCLSDLNALANKGITALKDYKHSVHRILSSL